MQKDIDRILIRTPGLKAKEIAKELGITKKIVNAFLHKNQDRYEKDDNFCWRHIGLGEAEVTLPSGWVTADMFEHSLTRAGNLESCVAVRFVFSEHCNTMIDCTSRVLALANQLVSLGKLVIMDFTAVKATRAYLNRAGFFDLLNEEVEVLPKRPARSAAKRHKGQSDTLVEFGGVDPNTVRPDLLRQLTDTFILQASNEYEMAVFTFFSELINNVVEHSQTPLSGFAGLQKYSGQRQHIQTVVSDSGIGIADSLRPALKAHYPYLHQQFGRKTVDDDIGLVSAVVSKGEISRSGGAGGLGFKSSREQAVKFDVRFSVRQERFCLKFKFRDGELVGIDQQKGLSQLLGTHICFDFYLD